jgi:predicted SAM-dependent methyltransferase
MLDEKLQKAIERLPESARKKVEETGEINLNAGSGTDCRPNFINYDIRPDVPEVDIVDTVWNIFNYFDEGTASNVFAFQILEHFNRMESVQVLELLCKLLKKGGRIHIRVPSLDDLVDEHRKGRIDDEFFFRTIYGRQEPMGEDGYIDYHKSGFTTKMVQDIVEKYNCVAEEANHVFGLGLLHITVIKL